MTRPRRASLLALSVPLFLIETAPAEAQTPRPTPTQVRVREVATPAAASTATPQATTVKSAEAAIAEALMANPVTAPYRLTIALRNGSIVLGGRVGSKGVHDAVVRTAIAYGLPISDQLVIDTNEAARVASAATMGPWRGAAAPRSILTSYTYPPPLFGRFDDPFFGLEPPLTTFPAWWPEVSARRLQQVEPVVMAQAEPQPIPPNTVEMTIDPRGVAIIRGVVPTEADKIDIGQRLTEVPGVAQIINELTVGPVAQPKPTAAPARRRPVDDDVPPPFPTPSNVKPRPEPSEPGGVPIRPAPPSEGPPTPRVELRRIEPRAKEGLLGRLDRAVQEPADLAGRDVRVIAHDGVATLSGSVPSVYEAMLAFRAVQQTPGVREVVDTLQFVVPDGSETNPLIAKGKPEDIEAYLEYQIRRQVGDVAHVDRVRLSGVQLQVVGSLDRADDRARAEAILRSMPILRGFTLLPEFRASDG